MVWYASFWAQKVFFCSPMAMLQSALRLRHGAARAWKMIRVFEPSNLSIAWAQTMGRNISAGRMIRSGEDGSSKKNIMGEGASLSSPTPTPISTPAQAHEPGQASSTEPQASTAPTAVAVAAASAAKYSQQYTNAYVELEKTLMSRIHESNRRRFRLALISTILFIIWVVAVFGKMIRKTLTNQTAGLAKETLENADLKVRTEELAMAVVHTVLNDPKVTANAATFLREASMVPETQQALLKLTLHVLQHEETLGEVANLLRRLVAQLGKDKEMVEGLGAVLSAALQEPTVKAAAMGLVIELCKDPEVAAAVTDLTLDIIAKESVSEVRLRIRLRKSCIKFLYLLHVLLVPINLSLTLP